MSEKPHIIFLGTPQFAVPTLERLISSGLAPQLVITQPDKPVGRKQELTSPPVKVIAEKNDIEVVQPKNKKELAEIIKKEKPDVCVLVAYGMIIPDEALAVPDYGFVNVHPSLLPLYRGSSPIQQALLDGAVETGVTIMKLDAEVDAGPIIVQESISITTEDTAESLHDKLSEIGADLVAEVLPKYIAGSVALTEQDHKKATMTGMVKREDGQVDWTKKAEEIERQFRAYFPWPGIFTYIGDKRLKIAKLRVFEGDFKGGMASGQVFLGEDKELLVACGSGAVELLEVQLEGKKAVSASEFVKGNKSVIGNILN